MRQIYHFICLFLKRQFTLKSKIKIIQFSHLTLCNKANKNISPKYQTVPLTGTYFSFCTNPGYHLTLNWHTVLHIVQIIQFLNVLHSIFPCLLSNICSIFMFLQQKHQRKFFVCVNLLGNQAFWFWLILTTFWVVHSHCSSNLGAKWYFKKLPGKLSISAFHLWNW